MGLGITFICFLYRHTLRWAAYYGRLFPACMLDLLICLLKHLVVCSGTRSIPSLILGQYKRICFPLPHPQLLRRGQGRLWTTGERRKELRSPQANPQEKGQAAARTAAARTAAARAAARVNWRRDGSGGGGGSGRESSGNLEETDAKRPKPAHWAIRRRSDRSQPTGMK